MSTSIGRNDPCPCGNGKKYKQCCLGKVDPVQAQRQQRVTTACVIILIASVIGGIAASREVGFAIAIVGAIAIGIYLWFSEPPPKKGSGGDPSAINFGR
ncbi:MAG: SEC-C metal-binding domain-containing protein [Acidobacteriota bacterium]